MVQRPWGRPSQAAGRSWSRREPARMTKEGGGGGRRRPIALQGALQCRGRARPPRARPPAGGGGARGGGRGRRGAGGGLGAVATALGDAAASPRLQVRTRRSGARGARWRGRAVSRATAGPAHTCHARRVPGRHARGSRSSGRGRPGLPSPSRREAPRAGLSRAAAWVAVAGGCARGSQVHLGRVGGLGGACLWALGRGWQV